MSKYIINTYRSPSRLFVCGTGEILSQEGTTQGNPLAMPWYSVNTSIMIQSLRLHIPDVKQVWLADDSAGGGRKEIWLLGQWIEELADREELGNIAERVFGDAVNITTEGKRHLRTLIGSKEYKDVLRKFKVGRGKSQH